jgi:hypothetical protein
MADLLVYKIDNRLDTYTAEDIAKRMETDPMFRDKWERRHQKGDVIDAAVDNRYPDNYKNPVFAVVRAPWLSVEDAKALLVPYERKVTNITEVSKGVYDIYVDRDIQSHVTLKPHAFVEIIERTSGRLRVRFSEEQMLDDFLMNPMPYIGGLDMPIKKCRFNINTTLLSSLKQSEFAAGRVALTLQEYSAIMVDKRG